VSAAAAPMNPAIAYCQRTPLRNGIEPRDASCLEEATQFAAAALAQRFGTGAITGRICAFVITAASRHRLQINFQKSPRLDAIKPCEYEAPRLARERSPFFNIGNRRRARRFSFNAICFDYI
jgi:hypothetical protein